MEFLAFGDGTIRDERYRVITGSGVDLPVQLAPRRENKQANSRHIQHHLDELVAGGSAPFAWKPKEVVFEEFTPGKDYIATVTLTNVTNSFMTFRVAAVSPLFSEALRVRYTVPPRLSPGLSWDLSVHFCPTSEDDFDTSIACRSDKGVFLIPIRARRKRPLLSVSHDQVNFGTVVIGKVKHRSFVVFNKGGETAKVRVAGSYRGIVEQRHVDPTTGKRKPFFTVSPMEYQIDIAPHSQIPFDVHFLPLEETDVECDIEFTEQGEAARLITVNVTGHSTRSPVYVASEDVHFSLCHYGETYCREVVLVNDSMVAVTAVPDIPEKLHGALRMSESELCIQAGSSFRVTMYFEPSPDLEAEVDATVAFTVKGQPLPATFRLCASLSHRTPTVNPVSLQYGRVFVNVQKVIPVAITNQSSLPQMMGFTSSPENVTVSPSVLQLLPGETSTCLIGVVPSRLGPFSTRLSLRNEFGDSQSISVAGYGVEPALKLAESSFRFPPCPLGQTVSASTVVLNTSTATRHFTFLVPGPCIGVAPSSGTLKPGERLPLVFRFSPGEEDRALPPPQQQQLDSEPEVTRVTKTQKQRSASRKAQAATVVEQTFLPPPPVHSDFDEWQGLDSERWSRHKTLVVRCVSNSSTDEETCFVSLRCTAVKPEVVGQLLLSAAKHQPEEEDGAVRGRASGKPAKKAVADAAGELNLLAASRPSSRLYVDFEEAIINHTKTQTCVLRNTGKESRVLQLRPVDPLSPFVVGTCLFDPVLPGDEVTFTIHFTPTEYGNYNDVIRFAAAESNDVEFFVRGSCSRVDLLIGDEQNSAPSDKNGSLHRVQFEPTRCGESAKTALPFFNNGSFPLEVYVQPTISAGAAHQTFLIHPTVFSILPNAKTTVTVLFSPKGEGLHSQVFCVKAGGHKQCLTAEGRGCKSSVYVTPPAELAPSMRGSDRTTGYAALLHDVECGVTAAHPLQLHFGPGETKSITVGSVGGGPSIDCIVEGWDEALFSSAGWSASPMKLSVPSGGRGIVSVSHNPRTATSQHQAVPFCSFSLAIRSASDLANSPVYHIRCTGV